MARHTTCTTVAGAWDGVSGVDIGLGVVAVIGIITAGIMAAVAAFSAAAITPQTLVIASWILMLACLGAIDLITKVRNYFFDHRLVCLDGDRCAIAWVQTIEADADGDRALNTILAPANEKTSESEYKLMFQASSLVYVDPGLASNGWHLSPKDNRKDANPATFGRGELPFFHCEIEGTYFDDWTTALLAYLWTLVAMAFAAFALAVAVTALGPVAWAIWIAIAVLVILLAIFGIHMLGGDPDVSEANAGPIGSSTPGPNGPIITDSGGNSIKVGDYVALIGRHICDTGHHGAGGCWDELHPISGIAKIPANDYSNAPANHTHGDIYDKYCTALRDFVVNAGSTKQGLTYLEHPAVG